MRIEHVGRACLLVPGCASRNLGSDEHSVCPRLQLVAPRTPVDVSSLFRTDLHVPEVAIRTKYRSAHRYFVRIATSGTCKSVRKRDETSTGVRGATSWSRGQTECSSEPKLRDAHPGTRRHARPTCSILIRWRRSAASARGTR